MIVERLMDPCSLSIAVVLWMGDGCADAGLPQVIGGLVRCVVVGGGILCDRGAKARALGGLISHCVLA